MLGAILEVLEKAKGSENRISWLSPGAGIRVCDFSVETAAEISPPFSAGESLDLLFCSEAKAWITMKSGRVLPVYGHSIYLFSEASEIQSLQLEDSLFKGQLVSLNEESIKASLGAFCTALGTKPDIGHIKALLRANEGYAVIREKVWSDLVCGTLNTICAEKRGPYALIMALELICVRSDFLLREPAVAYCDSYQADAVKKVHDYLLENLGERLTIQQLSQKFCISSTLLKSCFRRLYGQPINSYVQGCRMRRAAKLLSSSSLSVLQIASMVGYDSGSQFGVAFKRHYKASPSQYRKIQREINV